MKRKIAGIFLLVLFAHSFALSEIKDVGTPFIRNFSKHDYKAGTQNWAVAQDQKGFMYFANNEGLLVFDGVQWQLYRMPNLSMVRSIYIDNKGEIYIGAYNDFGKMIPDKNGKLVYQSFKERIPAEFQNFDDVWNILPYKDKIVFQSYNGAYICEESKPITVVSAPVRFPNAFNASGRLFFYDTEQGFFEFNGTSMVPSPGCDELKGHEIKSVMPVKGDREILICTLDKGMFLYDGKKLKPWNMPVNELLKQYQVFSAATLQNNYFALGTIQDGLIIIDSEGRLIQHINKKKGLQNNTILKVFSDRAGNLWLGLDNGIDYVNVTSPVTFLQHPEGFGAGYTELIHKGKLYLGTNQGLYVTDWDNGKPSDNFTMISGTHGQVWYLGVHDGILICGHNYGTFIIEGTTSRLISNIPVGWKYYIPKKHPDYLVGGTNGGLILFRRENSTWTFVKRIPGFGESSRVFEEDENGDLWISHGFKGVFRVRLNNNLDRVTESRFYTKNDGLPLNYNLNVFKIKGKIIIASESGIYDYVPENDRFIYSVYFNQLLNPLKAISFLKEDNNGNIWYVSENKAGIFRIRKDYNFQHITSPFALLSGKFINGFESIYPYSADQIFIGIENGFAHYSPQSFYNSYSEFSTYITKATDISIDSTFYYGNLTSNSVKKYTGYSFPYKSNSFQFYYSAPVYDNPDNIEYSYKLSGYNENWSKWTTSYSQEFSNIPYGKFVFMVKARNQLGIESFSDSLEFSVRAPWYMSVVAFIAYALIFLSGIFLLRFIIKKRIEISSRKERIRHLREYDEKEREYIRQALVTEKEIMTMKNERLRIDMIQQDKELANQAMNIVRKNEFLGKIKEELLTLKKVAHEEPVNEKILSIISRINKDVGHNKQREVFEKAFDEAHESFLSKLKSKYPALTPTELRLCAFLKMNISTKEIAPLMNISVRGVEICRYRVRKKLGIDRTTNLTSLLINL